VSYKKDKWLLICCLVISGILGFVFSLYRHAPQRVDPDAVVTIQTFHYPALFVQQLKNDPDAGRKIFQEFCAACHAKQPRIDVHAPRIGDTAAWQMRQRLGLPILLKITINGIGAMPARGGCFECSDQQLQDTIQYMLKDNTHGKSSGTN
jgi:cytochrome c5